MTPELWQQLKPLYHAALEVPKAERAGFLARECGGDDNLMRELAALLDVSDEQSETLDGAPLINLTDFFPPKPRTLAEGELLIGRFKIVRPIGAGGMGDVYEAIDLELGRIALKTIRPEIAGDPHILSQFKKEAQSARKVSGPHVCRIHELFVAPCDGQQPATAFLTMEFLEGITLAEKIQQSGALPWKEGRAIALQICAGLQTIHEAGMIHRDLKSRNIMLASRNGTVCAVVMDFGLARALCGPTSSTSTDVAGTGTIAGTPDYMAPEQFEGKEVGPPTDIYALGIVIYELLTGKHPFAANTPMGAAVSRGKRPPLPSSIQLGLPRRYDEIICRCLEFDAKNRYQSATSVAADLGGRLFSPTRLKKNWVKALAGATCLVLLLSSLLLIPPIGERVRGMLFSSRDKHIAILPVDLVNGDPQAQVLGDGLMDSLAGRLSNLDPANKSLWVVPASEVRARKVNDPASALREFGATIVVKSSFERLGEAARLRLTLIDPKKTREIGFADVQSPSGDLAALQDEAVTRLGRLMNVSVTEGPEPSSSRPATSTGYEEYVAALGYLERYDKPGNLDEAISYLLKATKSDPRFALAFARLGEAYTLRFHIDLNPESLGKALDYCRNAALLDDRVPATYVALANIHEITGEHDLAVQEYQRAIDLDPRNANAFRGMAASYRNAGRYAQAEAAYIKATELRPDDWNGYNYLGKFYDNVGRHHDAIIQFQHAIQLTPDNGYVYCNLGGAYLNSGDPQMLDAAEHAFHKSIAISPTYQAYANLGNLYGMEQRFTESAAATEKALQLNDQDYDVWNNLTQAYEALGEEDKANISRQRAIKLAEGAVKLNYQDAEAHATLAALFAKSGFRTSAMSNIHTSLALDPKNQNVLSEVADAYEVLGDRKLAIKYLELAIQNGYPREQLNADPNLQRIAADPAFRKRNNSRGEGT